MKVSHSTPPKPVDRWEKEAAVAQYCPMCFFNTKMAKLRFLDLIVAILLFLLAPARMAGHSRRIIYTSHMGMVEPALQKGTFELTVQSLWFYLQDDYRRKFRSQTSDNMDRWKAEQGRGREKRKIRREKSRRERVRRKKMQMREKVGKSRNTVFFQWFVAPEGRKVGSLKRRVRSQLARWEMKIARRCGAKHISKSKCTKHLSVGPLLEVEMSKKCTPLWREAHFQVKMHKTLQCRTTFGSCDVEKVHAVVARSTFRSQNVQSTSVSDHFWKLRCRKSARRCGAKHISKWKCTFGSCDVEKVHAVVAQSTFRSQNVKNTRVSDHFWRFRCRFASLHYITLHSTTLHYTTLHYTTLQLQLHSTTLH